MLGRDLGVMKWMKMMVGVDKEDGMRSVRQTTRTFVGALFLLLALLVGLGPQTASAHEHRDLVNGKYQGEVGFLNEPAYQGQLNGLFLAVASETEKNADGSAKAIEGLEKTLKAQVLAGGKTLDLQVQKRSNMPGVYAAYFMPTATGQYRFRVYGTINGEAIDETFESGPGRFSDVEAIGPLQFPNQVSNAPADFQAQLDNARLTAGMARNIAFIGVVFGALGVLIAALALTRRPAVPTIPPQHPAARQADQGDD